MKNKKGLSTIVITVLLILLSLSVASIIYAYGRGTLATAQKEGAISLARSECPKAYEVQIAGCFNKTSNTINVDLINLKNDLPYGTLISLQNDRTKILTLFNPDFTNQDPIKAGEGRSVTITPNEVDLAQFNLKKIKLVPLYLTNGIKVMCDELSEVDVTEC